MSVLDRLVGKTVVAVRTYQGSGRITFELAGEDLYEAFKCDGECCSHTWIEHVTGLSALIGQRVLEASCLESGVDPNDHTDEVVRVYEDRLVTALGVFSLEYRNGSNGYYGGDLLYAGRSFNSDDARELPLEDDF